MVGPFHGFHPWLLTLDHFVVGAIATLYYYAPWVDHFNDTQTDIVEVEAVGLVIGMTGFLIFLRSYICKPEMVRGSQ